MLEKDKDKDKEEELDKMSASIIVGQSEEYDTLLRDLNAREKVNVLLFVIDYCLLFIVYLLLLIYSFTYLF